MKGGLCIIYTSLLTISVLSSCALFILVLSEALQVDEVNTNVDLSGLHNVSKKSSTAADEPPKPDASSEIEDLSKEKKTEDTDHQMTFPDTLSVNSVTTDGLPDIGQPPILISLAENVKLDLRTPEELLYANESEKHNETTSFAIADSEDDDEEKAEKVTEKPSTEPRLVVKAKPFQEGQPEDVSQTTTTAPQDAEIVEESQPEEQLEENIPIKPETPQEDIPSFSEWAQKQLAEAEKKDTVLNHSSQPSHSNTNFSSKNTKLRSKNYASPACGAKIVAVNPEAGSPSSILSPNRDEYMLNTCNSRIWFVVELCEAVQAQKIEIANFELFSSTPKDIAVGFSDRFPVREWASVGQFTAQDMRDVQSFDLYPHIFGKFIRVELLSHHGSEHYCPISLFKVYGTSEFEVLEKESSQHSAHIDEDEEDEIIDVPDVPAAEAEPSKNLFGSARDAVMSIMKKAAQALVKTEVPNNVSSEHNDTSTDNMYKKCCSPSHIIVCDNCSETLYNDVYELLSCSSERLTSLVRQVFLRDTLKCTSVCQNYGLDFKSTKTIEFGEERAAYVNSFFPPKYIAALCNILAIKEKKVVLNTSFETEMNVTSNITVDESPQKLNSETNSEKELKLVPIKDNDADDKINETAQPDDRTVVPEQKPDHVPIELPKDDKDKKDMCKEDSKTSSEEQMPAAEPQVVLTPQEKQSEEKNEIDRENQDSPKTDIKNGKDVNTDKPKEILIVGDEISDQVMIESDSFISDLDQMAVDPTPAGAHAALNQNQAQASLQKESVFLRLSNRVKTLERNMSLSGQYLEELSRRYKKQVEEMQKSFEKTVLQMSEERRKSNEREQKYIDQMTLLQDRLAQMTIAIEMLIEARDSWFGNLTFFKFFIYQAIIIVIAFYYISKKKKPETILVPIPKKIKKKQDKFRRKSVEGVSGHATPSAKKRRPSEEAFQIVRHSDEIEKDLDAGEWQVAKKNRRRKPSMIIHRNVDSEVKQNTVQDCMRELQENPIPLDEAEFFAPVSEPKEFSENKAKELPKTNGSFFNNLKTKTMKTRRLSSPAFLRTFNRQSSRSNPSPVVRTLEPIFNGKLSKKAASESPTGSLWSESTDISQNGLPESESGGKKKKSFKNMLRKVF